MNKNPKTDHLKVYQFKPGNNENPYGRPKSAASKMKKIVMTDKELREFDELSAADERGMLKFLLSCSKEMLEKISEDDRICMFARNKAKSLLKDFEQGTTMNTDKMAERAYGKDAERHELTGANGEPLMIQPTPPAPLTPHEAAVVLRELDDKL